jgi:predicted enzyme related to lactoylglutathione lyase
MLLVQDMPRVRAFYTELLGLVVVPEFSSPTGEFVFLHSKASRFNLMLQDIKVGTYGASTERGGVLIGFMVEDAAAVYQEWQTKGVEFVSGITDVGAGRSFVVRDPDGNYLNIYDLYPEVRKMQEAAQLI